MLKGWAPTQAGRLKAAHRQAEWEAGKDKRKQMWREVRCFWSWPFGHSYDRSNGKCVGCGHYWDIY